MKVIIIGGGHNGLVAAFYLARAGFRPLVLEARDEVGGGAVTAEIHPGFRCPALTHNVLVHGDIAADMGLAGRGVDALAPAVDVFAPAVDGPPVVVGGNGQPGGADALGRRDADAYREYRATVSRIADVIGTLLAAPPPDLDEPGASDLWNLLKAGRRFRALDTRDQYRLLRWAPMPVADFVGEWFENDRLRAAAAAPGLVGTMFGPRSAGSTLVLLMNAAHRNAAGGGRPVRGGPGAVTRAMAASAREAGAEIRTGARVEQILVGGGRARGVLVDGRELPADAVVSAADPKTTFLRLIDPIELQPGFLMKMRNYRAAGAMAKVNLALSALPPFPGANASTLSGRIHIGPSLDYLERAFDRAKYGELPEHPWLEVSIPSVLDPDLAPAGSHVLSAYVFYPPYRLRHGEWATASDALLATTLTTLEPYAPGLGRLVVGAQVITPGQLESDYGLHAGHVFHGELALDQLFTMRPVLGSGRYASPVERLFLCGAGTHPGGFMIGASGRLAAREIQRTLRS